MCSCFLGSLVEQVHQLETLRHEFNLLRKQVGMKIIVESLGEPKETYEAWVKDIESVEDVSPCGAFKRLLRTPETAESSLEVIENFVKSEGEDEMFAEEPLEFCEYFGDSLLKQNKEPKLTQMRAAVVLNRLDYGTHGSQACVPNLNEAGELTGNCELMRECSLEELPRGTIECLAKSKSTSGLPSPRKEVTEDSADLEIKMRVIAEQLLKNPRPRRTLLSRQFPELYKGIHKDDEYCAVFEKLPSEEICSQENNPLVPSNSRVLRTDAAENFNVITVEGREVIECNGKQAGACNEIQRHFRVPEVLKHSEERPKKNKKPRKSLPSRPLQIGDFEDVAAEEDFGEDDPDSSRKEFPCGYCELTFSTKLSLLEHWKHLHSLDSANPKTPKCLYCLRLFLKKKSLLVHLDRVHYGIPRKAKSKREKTNIPTSDVRSKESQQAVKIHCFVCDNFQTERFSNLAELETHALTEVHLKNIKLKFNVHCNVCRVGFGGNADALQHHLKSQSHSEEMEMLGKFNRETFCSACRVHCGTPKDLRKHISSVGHWRTCQGFRSRVPVNILRNQNLKCPECPKTFTNRAGLQTHMKLCHKPGLNVCEFCGKVFLDSKDCKLHRKIHNIPKLFSCTECIHTVETERQLRTHKSNFHSRTSIVCPTCGKMFSRSKCLLNHEKTHHSTGKKKRYKCSYTDCSKTFGFPLKLRRHKYIEHKDDVLKETPYVCLVCFKGFKITNELKVHMDAHDNLKCYFCGKYFQMTSNLEHHLRVHFGEKPYSCNYCNNIFASRQNMNGHIKRHIAMDMKQMQVTSPD